MEHSSKYSSAKEANLFFLIGFMGSGKSHWGKIWSSVYHYSFFDLDDAVVAFEKEPISSIFEKKGEGYFRDSETSILKTFSGKSNFIIACGGGTPCFNDNMEWMNEHGTTIYMKATPAHLAKRLISEKDKRPVIKNIADDDLENFISKKLEERKNYYSQAKYVIDVSTVSEKTFLDLMLQLKKYE
jgi:shikimate kinase